MIVGSVIGNMKRLGKFYTLELVYYLYSFVKKDVSNQTRVVIFGQGRTGSTLLESLLCSTGYFKGCGEVFNVSKGEVLHPVRYLRGLSKKNVSRDIIFHVKIYQLTKNRKRPVDPEELLKHLIDDGWSVIYLQRKNKVKQALSSIVAEHRGAYHRHEDKESQFSLTVDCEDLIRRVNNRIAYEKAEHQALADIKYHKVIYEDDLENAEAQQKTIDGVLDYLSLDRQKVSTKHRKVVTQLPEEMIVNYDDFNACLIAQGWQDLI